jgi:hypothetical protein
MTFALHLGDQLPELTPRRRQLDEQDLQGIGDVVWGRGQLVVRISQILGCLRVAVVVASASDHASAKSTRMPFGGAAEDSGSGRGDLGERTNSLRPRANLLHGG